MRRFVFIALVSCATTRGPAAAAPELGAPKMPAPYRGREAAAVALNATCVGCHAEQAAAWQGSMHRQAFDNDAFQTALRAEPSAFCRGCHAPEANPDAPTIATELGVACVTCHVTTGGEVLAAPRESPSPGRRAPHPLVRAAAFAGTASCASCHEFRFPGDAQLMQTTVREHVSVRGAGTCTSCHGSHALREIRDPKWLASQLRVRVVAVDRTGVRVTLEQPNAGHAFPTGDLFRRLAVHIGSETRYLARHFEAGPAHLGRQVTRDDRVFDGPRVVEVSVALGTKEVPWSVTLERVAGMTSGSDPGHATIESAVTLHSGVLELAPQRPGGGDHPKGVE